MFDMPVIEHCEEQTLKGDGVAHEGFQASTLGLRGIPGEAESIMALRDISLAELTGGAVHIAHMSARQTLDAVRYGKARGARVTCEVTPHHFVLTDEMLGGAGAVRHQREDEPAAARSGRSRRDAAGHRRRQRRRRSPPITRRITTTRSSVEFDHAPFGITGLETAVSLCFDRLVHAGVISLSRLVELLSVNPARILRVPGGSLAEGAPADITILAPDLAVTVSVARDAIEVEEHAVRRLDAARRRRRDHRRRADGVRERSELRALTI